VFLHLKTALKYTKTYHFGDKKMIVFLRRGPAPSTTLQSLDASLLKSYATAWCTLSIILYYLLFVYISFFWFLLPLVVNKDVHKTVLSTIFGVTGKKYLAQSNVDEIYRVDQKLLHNF